MENFSLSYREVLLDTSSQDEFVEITLNTGATPSTLQDIKVAEKSGGYCYRDVKFNHNRNRYIYWRTYQDVLELSEISLDINLHRNNLRYKFTDTPVINVSISEQERYISLLVTTVSSLHRFTFSHPDVLADGSSSAAGSVSGSGSSSGSSIGASIEFTESQSFSIFREATLAAARDPACFYVLETQNNTSNNAVPHAATSLMSANGEEAYFALACQNQLLYYVMESATGYTTVHQLKQYSIMPRLFLNLKEALVGKNDTLDADHVTGLTFTWLNNQMYLLALYRNDYLRVWSMKNQQIECSIDCVRDNNEQRVQGPQSNAIRKISSTSFCVFLSQAAGAEFVCMELLLDGINGSGLNLVHRKVVTAPQLDLTDYDVSPTRIWALWSNAEGEFSVSSYSLVRGTGINWYSAAMEPPPDRYCVDLEQGTDPKETYCKYIFHPGKFEQIVIAKALYMFRRTKLRFDAKQCTMSMLKDHVCQAVENEIQNEVKDFDVTDDEYLEIATRLWERFYSCCEQYHMKFCQPTGLVILEPIDAVCVVKKNTFSLLRPCEIVEHLMLSGEDIDIGIVVPLYFVGNERLGNDLVNLVSIIALLEKWLPEDVKMDLSKKLYQLEVPNVFIAKLSAEIIAGGTEKEILPRNFLVEIREKLQPINALHSAIEMLLDSLRMDHGNPEAMQTHMKLSQTTRFLMSVGALFGSHLGVSLLSETVRQTASTRFAICRNLFILQQILIDTYAFSNDVLETLRSRYIPDTAMFLQCYYVMGWISEQPININAAAMLEPSIQRLNLLQLTNGSGRIYSSTSKCHTAPLLRVFLNAKGLYTALVLYSNEFETSQSFKWQNTLMPLTAIVSQLIWAVSFNFVFGEWLFGTCQHIVIQDYVRLLSNWCEWNMCSRQFILAVSLLDCGETNKAYDLFRLSANGVLKEHFLADKIIKNTPLGEQLENIAVEVDSMSVSKQGIVQYYLKVIQLFEQHNALDHIINLATVAMGHLTTDDPQLPMFQSIVFNNQLKLQHYEEAYHSLIHNAEQSRRKDCLRQLVATLFESERLDLLMRFPYVGLHEEFESIVESRARSLVIDQNNIYDFLYAFHVNSDNMRKASAIMYEQALRLQLESDSIQSMERRCASLLVCINAMYLIDERYRWIAKPVIGEDFGGANSSKQTSDSMSSEEFPTQAQVVVLEIKDIRQELLQTQALVDLSQARKDIHSFLNAGPQELAMILSSSGLFTAAIKLAEGFEISLLPIFDSLTAACVHIVEENASEAWSWLQQNDLADLPHRNKAVDMAWSLLQKLVKDNEKEDSTQIRKSIVNKILSLNGFVPQWLYNDYKLANCSELLYLFVKHSRLLEASELAQEMINAMLGAGSEYFSFKHVIAITNPVMCLPINTLDLLLHGLKLNAKEDIEYKQAAVELEELIKKYILTAERTAHDKIDMTAQIKTARLRSEYPLV